MMLTPSLCRSFLCFTATILKQHLGQILNTLQQNFQLLGMALQANKRHESTITGQHPFLFNAPNLLQLIGTLPHFFGVQDNGTVF